MTFDALPWARVSRGMGWIIIFMYSFNGGVCLLLISCYVDVGWVLMECVGGIELWWGFSGFSVFFMRFA